MTGATPHGDEKPMFCMHAFNAWGQRHTLTGTITLKCGLVAVCNGEREKRVIECAGFCLIESRAIHSCSAFRQRSFFCTIAVLHRRCQCILQHTCFRWHCIHIYKYIIKTNRQYFLHTHTHIQCERDCGCVRARVEIHFVWPYAIVFRSSILLSLALSPSHYVCTPPMLVRTRRRLLFSLFKCKVLSLLISLPSKGKWQTHKLYTIK